MQIQILEKESIQELYVSCQHQTIFCTLVMISVKVYTPPVPENYLLIYWVWCPKLFYTIFYTLFIMFLYCETSTSKKPEICQNNTPSTLHAALRRKENTLSHTVS